MITHDIPIVFYDFASGVVDITADDSADNHALIKLALDNLPPMLNPAAQMEQMRLLTALLAQLLDVASDQELHDLWWSTDARIKFREGPHTRDFLLDAQRCLQERIKHQARTPE